MVYFINNIWSMNGINELNVHDSENVHDITAPGISSFSMPPYTIDRKVENNNQVKEGEVIAEVVCGKDVRDGDVVLREADRYTIPAHATGELIIILSQTDEPNKKIGEIIEK